jgi:hypothetical protein
LAFFVEGLPFFLKLGLGYFRTLGLRCLITPSGKGVGAADEDTPTGELGDDLAVEVGEDRIGVEDFENLKFEFGD